MILLILILSLLGILDAAWLVRSSLFGTAACGAGSDCSAVLSSSYAYVFGIPLSAYGLGFYLAVAVESWHAFRPEDRSDALRGVLLLALPASVASLYLIYLQGAVIHAWCPFCLTSAALSFSILTVALLAQRGGNARPFFALPRPCRHHLPLALALILPPLACSAVPADTGPGEATDPGGTEVVAHIGSRNITLDEIDRAIRTQLDPVRNRFRNEWLDRQVLQTAAAERGVSVIDMLEREALDTISIAQADIDRRYEEVKSRVAPNVSRDSLDAEIRRELRWSRGASARAEFTRRLREAYGTELRLPSTERVNFHENPYGSAAWGPPDAPVTIVEFSDLECGFCARAQKNLENILAEHPSALRVVFRHFPLPQHTMARFAAEVAACTESQDAFKPFISRIFANQNAMSPSDLIRHAEAVGLNIPKLRDCITSGQGRSAVDADIAEGKSLGIHQTPSFFVNGRYVDSPNHLKAFVEEELQQSSR